MLPYNQLLAILGHLSKKYDFDPSPELEHEIQVVEEFIQIYRKHFT